MISIHAPVKGATKPLAVSTAIVCDFNPRTREGCDYTGRTEQLRCQHFNPRTREGCDCCPVVRCMPFVQISIHAPVKGATFFGASTAFTASIFQSTHP